jgi:hypothetical protein
MMSLSHAFGIADTIPEQEQDAFQKGLELFPTRFDDERYELLACLALAQKFFTFALRIDHCQIKPVTALKLDPKGSMHAFEPQCSG